jgi:N-acetylglucosamine malate deacetylase 2
MESLITGSVYQVHTRSQESLARDIQCTPAGGPFVHLSGLRTSWSIIRSVMRSILFIFAHPDDESFYAGGTIAKCSHTGARIALICATRGQRGSTADLCTIEDLPNVREAELRGAARHLDVADSDVHVLDFQDQQVATTPQHEIRQILVSIIRRVKPHVVITFDPNGVNEHPDPVAIARFATDAIAASADPRWYPADAPHAVKLVLWTSPVPVFALGQKPELKNEPGIDYLIDITSHSAAKQAALASHRTQWPGLKRVFFVDRDPADSSRYEAFRVASGARPVIAPQSALP